MSVLDYRILFFMVQVIAIIQISSIRNVPFIIIFLIMNQTADIGHVTFSFWRFTEIGYFISFHYQPPPVMPQISSPLISHMSSMKN